jgi:hypothetical protein
MVEENSDYIKEAQRGGGKKLKIINILSLPCFTSLFIRLRQNRVVTQMFDFIY